MSHRLALVLSITLTLVLAAGILVARDRFFDAEAATGLVAAGPTATSPAPAVTGASVPVASDASRIATTPRVIEIPLPTAESERISRPTGDDDHGRDHDDDDDDDEGEDDD